MSRKPRRYEPQQPASQSEHTTLTPGEALIGHKVLKALRGNTTPSFLVRDTLVGIILTKHPEHKRVRLLPLLQAALESAPPFLEEIHRLNPTILEELGGKEKVLERLLRDIAKKRRACSDHVLKIHAALLQTELNGWEQANADKAWLENNLPRLLQILNQIRCGCIQQTRISTSIYDDLLYPLDRSTPTNAFLLYAILGYHHGNRKPNTIQKRLTGKNARP